MVDLNDFLARPEPSKAHPVAVITPVGMEAAVGDVVVAAVVLTEVSNDVVQLESIRHGIAMRIQLKHRAHNSLLAEFRMLSNTSLGTFTYEPGGLVVRADSLLGSLFDDYMDIPAFAKAVGFCPRSEDDMRGRLKTIAKNLTRIVREQYPNCVMQVSPQMFDFDLERLWQRGVRPFPSTPIVISDEFEQQMSEADRVRIFFAYLTSEALAVATRSARIMDYAEMYPVLKLDTNRGYGCPELYRGLRKTAGFEVKGIRGALTDRWMKWAVSHLDMPTAVKPPSTKPDTDDGDMTPGAVYEDDQGRKAMPFNRPLAVKMSDELHEEMENGTKRVMKLRNWTRTFLPSVHKQLQDGKSLSGRQMFVLYEVYNGKMI